jgi:ribulose 1,5-bisphosphate synthetase/thiazole synthase
MATKEILMVRNALSSGSMIAAVLFAGCAAPPERGQRAATTVLSADKPAGSYVLEPAKRIPVAYDVDVAVAGGGISGVFAALAAAREGAQTVLIERFGDVGGNIGPGMNSPEADYGLIEGGHVIIQGAPKDTVKGDKAGLIKEFANRYFALKPDDTQRFLADSNRAVYVAFAMLQEAGVKLMLSAYAGDPIMENGKVRGVFVENKSGRQAVRAKVVIDATGEADVARRARAAIIWPSNTWELDHHSPTGMGTWAVMAGVDPARLDGKKAAAFAWKKDIGQLAQIDCGGLRGIGPERYLMGIKAQLVRPHLKVDAANAEHISTLEAAVRMYVFEYVQRCRENVPGCENAYLLFIAPFLGARGGPCIDGEYTLTAQDCREGKQFDDVIYVYGEPINLRYSGAHGGYKWPDVPYRVMIPKKLDGLIAVGRSASCIPDTLLRVRESAMYLGQTGGIAAALAARAGLEPRAVDIKQLQRRLLEVGYYLGEPARLEQLGLK